MLNERNIHKLHVLVHYRIISTCLDHICVHCAGVTSTLSKALSFMGGSFVDVTFWCFEIIYSISIGEPTTKSLYRIRSWT